MSTHWVRSLRLFSLFLPLSALTACGVTDPACTGANCSMPSACSLTANTSATSVISPSGCVVLQRDTTACQAARQAAGLSGVWLKFSCRVSLSLVTQGTGQAVQAVSDGQPDYLSNYFPKTNPCYESYTGAIQNPNTLAARNYTIPFPLAPTMNQQPMMDAVLGLARNGVPIFGNFAAPGDDIYQEAKTFDRCGAHPQMQGAYHYHSEPLSISYQDAHFIGVLRDGHPIYGRNDATGLATGLDTSGGHLGTTEDSPTVPVYHYHVNEQISTQATSAGQKQWFLTTGLYRGTPAACTTCR